MRTEIISAPASGPWVGIVVVSFLMTIGLCVLYLYRYLGDRGGIPRWVDVIFGVMAFGMIFGSCGAAATQMDEIHRIEQDCRDRGGAVISVEDTPVVCVFQEGPK